MKAACLHQFWKERFIASPAPAGNYNKVGKYNGIINLKTFLLISVILIVLFRIPLFAEEDNYLQDYLLSYPETIYSAVTAPGTWQNDDWLKASAIIVTTGGLYLLDEELRDLYQRNRIKVTDDIFTVAEQFGEVKIMLPLMAVTALGGYIAKDEKTIDTSLLCLKSSLISLAVTQTLKLASQRQRPFKEEGKKFWQDSGISFSKNSFPSGHSTLVWSLAPVLAEQFKKTRLVPPTVYTIAVLTSLSRLNSDQHWTSDVFAGAVIGYVTGKMVLQDTPRIKLGINPLTDRVSLTYCF
jgi:hypothetical protein